MFQKIASLVVSLSNHQLARTIHWASSRHVWATVKYRSIYRRQGLDKNRWRQYCIS